MEDAGHRKTGTEQALMLVKAMEGRDEATRLALWKAAKRYRRRDSAAPEVQDAVALPW